MPLDRDSFAMGVEAFPLERVRRRLAARKPGGDADLRAAASDLGLPPARLRELLAFFPDLSRADAPARVCAGTSCFLAGGAALAAALPRAQRVHCLGHCDASPCAATASGTVRVRCRPETVQRAVEEQGGPARRPSIRCAAPEPIVTRNVAHGDGSSLDAARRRGVYSALERALARSPADLLDAVERSGERGRGGAGFPTGAKWRAAAAAAGPGKVVVANGDEGDPGSYVDRVLLEEDPHSVLEGLALCARAVGADQGVVFVRSEYPRALERVERAVADAGTHGLLGGLRVRVASGFGSYVGGEETALLHTLEGRAGEVRLRPPYPVERGLEGRPTVVNNVETLVAIPWIAARGGEAYRRIGTEISSGTKALCLNAGFAAPGIVEVELGRSLRDVIEGDGGSTAQELEAVLLGGPMGSLLFPDAWDVELCYGALAGRGIRLGHGGLVALPRGVDWSALFRHWLEFMVRESCGKCAPCRDGSRRARDAVERGATARELDATLSLMERASLCGFGKGAPGPSRALLARFGDALL